MTSWIALAVALLALTISVADAVLVYRDRQRRAREYVRRIHKQMLQDEVEWLNALNRKKDTE